MTSNFKFIGEINEAVKANTDFNCELAYDIFYRNLVTVQELMYQEAESVYAAAKALACVTHDGKTYDSHLEIESDMEQNLLNREIAGKLHEELNELIKELNNNEDLITLSDTDALINHLANELAFVFKPEEYKNEIILLDKEINKDVMKDILAELWAFYDEMWDSAHANTSEVLNVCKTALRVLDGTIVVDKNVI